MWNKFGGVGIWFGLGSQTQGDCHDLCLAKEETATNKYSNIVGDEREVRWQVPILPTVGKLRSNILEIGVPHIVNPEDVDVKIFRNAFLNGSMKSQREIFAFLRRLGEVDNFGAL